MRPAPQEAPFDVRPPRDRMVLDRLRAAARALYLAARAPALFLLRPRWKAPSPPPPPSRVSRLLVVRADRLGDMALTAEALLVLRRHFSKAEITLLAPPGPLALLEGHPAVDHRVPLAKRGLPEGLAGRFDLAVDFTPGASLRAALLAAGSKAPHRAGFASAGRQAFFTLRAPLADPARHVVDLNRDLLKALGANPDPPPKGPTLFVNSEERGRAQSLLASLGAAAPRVAVHPGAFYASQRWPPERFADLIARLTERLGAACIVLAGPGEERIAERVCAATPDALPVPPQTVRGLMSILAVCDLFIGNNSGPLHVAGALGLPTVSTLGPTDPARFAPRGPADLVVRHALACSPCGRGRCWHHTCLRSIETGEVLAHAMAVLQEALPRREAR